MTTIFFNDWRSSNHFLQEGNFISLEMELSHHKNDTAAIEMICDSVEPLENGVYLAAVMTGKVYIEGDLLLAVAKETEPDIFFLSLRVAGQSPYYFTVGVGEDEDC